MEARDLGDAGVSPRLAERAAVMTCAGRRDIDLLTGEPGIGKNKACRQEADNLHDGVHQVPTRSDASFVFGQQRRTFRGAARIARPSSGARRREVQVSRRARCLHQHGRARISTSGPGRKFIPSLVAETQVRICHPFVDVARHGHDAMIRVQRA